VVGFLDVLRVVDQESSHEIVENWSNRILTDLSDPAIDWLGKHFADSLDDPQRATLISHVDQAHQRIDLTEEEGRRYQRFMASLNEDGRNTSELDQHLANMMTQIAQQYQNQNGYLNRVFPAVAPLASYGPAQQAAQMLSGLFPNAQSQPELFGWLHDEMANHWPDPDDVSYNPDQLFENAVSFLGSHSQIEEAPSVLRSIWRMVEKGVVGEAKTVEVLDAACDLWPYHPDQGLRTITSFRTAPSPARVASMAEDVDLDNTETVTMLQEAWSHAAGLMSEEERMLATEELIALSPQNPDDDPDFALRLWFDVQQDRATLLRQMLLEGELTDEFSKRLWLQVDRRIEELDASYFTDILPRLLALPDLPETYQEVLRSQERISALFPGQADRNELGRSLLQALVDSPSREIKNRLAQWIKDTGAVDALARLGKGIEPSPEDVDLLEDHFRRSRYLNKYNEERR
jgi:hypothetical protein